MAVDFLTPDSISTRLIAAFNEARDGDGNLLFPDHTVPGTPGYNQRKLIADLLDSHYFQVNRLMNNMSLITASGVMLDEWGSFLNTPRKGATPSVGQALITSNITGASLQRLYGTRTLNQGLLLFGGLTTFQILSSVSIPETSTSATVTISALSDSVFTTAPAGTRLTVNHPSLGPVLTAEISVAPSGGSGIETDDQYRFRLIRALTGPYTYEGLKGRILGNENVSDCVITESRYGPGTIEAFVTPTASFPATGLRTELEALYQGPGRLYVIFPTYESIALRIRVKTQVSLTPVMDYINNLGFGETLVLNQVESILQAAGSGDAQVIGIKRGNVDESGTPVNMLSTATVTNQTLASSRSKWLASPEWVTLCGI